MQPLNSKELHDLNNQTQLVLAQIPDIQNNILKLICKIKDLENSIKEIENCDYGADRILQTELQATDNLISDISNCNKQIHKYLIDFAKICGWSFVKERGRDRFKVKGSCFEA